MKNGADPRCYICTQYEETIDHLISRCPTLARNEYLNRLNRLSQYLHYREFNINAVNNNIIIIDSIDKRRLLLAALIKEDCYNKRVELFLNSVLKASSHLCVF